MKKIYAILISFPLKGLFILFCFFSLVSLNAQVVRDFSVVYQEQVQGGMQVISNSALGVAQGGRNPNTEGYNPQTGDRGNNGVLAGYIDIDSSSDTRFTPIFTNLDRSNPRNTTFSSSAAELKINQTGREGCAQVVQAYLYWAGQYAYARETTSEDHVGVGRGTRPLDLNIIGSNREFIDADGDGNRDDQSFPEIKILPPGGDTYYNISLFPDATVNINPGGIRLETILVEDGIFTLPGTTATRTTSLSNNQAANIRRFSPVVCRTDITELVQSLDNPDGIWTVADINGIITNGDRPPRDAGPNDGVDAVSGWNMIVIYEDQNEPERIITISDGLVNIIEGGDDVNFTVDNIQTIPFGPVNADIFVGAIEGDPDREGDFLQILSASTSDPENVTVDPNFGATLQPNVFHDGSDEPRGNFFNGSIATVTREDLLSTSTTIRQFEPQPDRFPNNGKNYTFEGDNFILNNTGNLLIDNNQTRVDLTLTTDRDNIISYVNAFAIEVIAPRVVVLKQAFDEMGDLVDQSGNINYGSTLTYEMTLTNIGNDNAINLVLEDYIPANTELTAFSGGHFFEFEGTTGDRRSFSTIGSTDAPDGNEPRVVRTGLATPPLGFTDNPFPYESELIRFEFNAFAGEANDNRPDDANPNNNFSLGYSPCATGCSNIQEIKVRFQVTVLEECAPSLNACANIVQNIALIDYEGEENIDFELSFPEGSFFGIIQECNPNFDPGPTIQLTPPSLECNSAERTICENNGTVALTAGRDFDEYNLYFFNNEPSGFSLPGDLPSADSVIDETAATFNAQTATTNPSFTVNQSGFYVLEGALTGMECANEYESFTVDLFDVSAAQNQPLRDLDLGGILQSECPSNPGLQVVLFELCGDSFDIPTNFPPGTELIWSKVDASTCVRDMNDSELCPVSGTNCGYILEDRDVVGDNTTLDTSNPNDLGTSSFRVTEIGDYQLSITLSNGGCNFVSYFRVIPFDDSLFDINAADPRCDQDVVIAASGFPGAASNVIYDLEYFVFDGTNFVSLPSSPGNLNPQTDPTDDDYGTYEVERPNLTTTTSFTYRVIATPRVNSSVSGSAGTTIGTSCDISRDDVVTYNIAELTNDALSLRQPNCFFDQNPSDDVQENRGTATITAPSSFEEYTYQLINVDATPDSQVQLVNSSNNTHAFDDLLPGTTYKIRVFFNGQGVTVNPNQSVDPNDNCVVETAEFTIDDVEEFGTLNPTVVRRLTCEPSIVRFEFSGPVTSYSIPALSIPNTIYNGAFEVNIDDFANAPNPPIDEDTASPIVNNDIRFINVDGTPTFTIFLNNGNNCSESFTVPNPLSLYSPLTIEEPVPHTDVLCNGQSTGRFTINTNETVPSDTNVSYIVELPSSPLHQLDFGTNSSNIQTGFERVTTTTIKSGSNDFGWAAGTTGIDSRDRTSGAGIVNELERDLIFSPDPETFEISVPNGAYRVTVTLGDFDNPHDNMTIDAEGVRVVSDIDRGAGQIDPETFYTSVNDGILTLRFDDPDTAAPNDLNWVVNGIVVEEVLLQTSSTFTNLEAGTYDVQLLETITFADGTTSQCETDTVSVTIEEPAALTAPVIRLEMQNECTSTGETGGIIEVVDANSSSTDYGGTPPYTFQLFRDGGTTPFATAPRNTSDPQLLFEDLPAGSYRVNVLDDSGVTNCPAPLSNTIVIEPVPVYTLSEAIANPTCNASGDEEPTVEVTISATFTTPSAAPFPDVEYRVSRNQGGGSTPSSAIFNNTTGVFDLAPGRYTIESRTVDSNCIEDIAIVVPSIERLRIQNIQNRNRLSCFDSDDASVNVVISRISTSPQYDYVIEIVDVSTTPPTVVDPNFRTVTNEVRPDTFTIEGLSFIADPLRYRIILTDRRSNCISVSEAFAIAAGPTPPTVSVIDGPRYNCVTNTYSVTLEGAGGTPGRGGDPEYEYAIDDPNTPDLNPGTPEIDPDYGYQTSATFNNIVPPSVGDDTNFVLLVRDGNSCGNIPTNQIFNPIPDLVATEATSNLCIPRITADAPITLGINVSGAADFSYTIPSLASFTSATTVTDFTGNSGTFTITLPRTTPAGDYDVNVFDSNHESCPAIVTFTVNEPIEAVVTDSEEILKCNSSGDLTGVVAYVEIRATGGTGIYSYQVSPRDATTTIVSGTSPDTGDTLSNSNPRFEFDNSFDRETIEIRIVDSSAPNCASNVITLNPVFPELFTVSESLETINCSSSDRLVLTPSIGDPADYVYTYDVDGTITADNPNNSFPVSGTVNYTVRNTATGCSVSGGPLNVPVFTRASFEAGVPTSIQCLSDGTTTSDGSYTLTFNPQSFTAPYRFLVEEEVSIAPSVYQSTTITPSSVNNVVGGNIEALFSNLSIGRYRITVFDVNDCDQTFVPFVISGIPEISIGDAILSTPATCVDGVDIYFYIEGGTEPADFRLALVDTDFVDPSLIQRDEPPTPFDVFQRLGNTDFTSIPQRVIDERLDPDGQSENDFFQDILDNLPGSSGISSIPELRSRYFRIRRQRPGEIYLIRAREGDDACSTPFETERGQDAPEILAVNTANATNTGGCDDVNTGSIDVTFSISNTIDQVGNQFRVEVIIEEFSIETIIGNTVLIDADGRGTYGDLDPAADPDDKIIIDGLPEVTGAFVRITFEGTVCSEPSAPFNIGRDPELENFTATPTTASCAPNEDFTIDLRAQGGTLPYRFLIQRQGLGAPNAASTYPITTPTATSTSVQVTLPASTSPIDDRIRPADALEIAANPDIFGFIDAYIVDAQGCTLQQLNIPLELERLPELTFTSTVDCKTDDGPFTVDFRIDNFDETQVYTLRDTGTSGAITPTTYSSTSGLADQDLTFVTGTTQATGVLTVNAPGSFTVEVSSNENPSCTDPDSFVIFPRLQAEAIPSGVDCFNEFEEITVNITGGFAGETNREITAVITETSTSRTATETLLVPSNNSTPTLVFNNVISGATSFPLRAGEAYTVQIFDERNNTISSSLTCDVLLNVDPQDPIVPAQISTTQNEVSCPTEADGSLRIVIDNNGSEIPPAPVYRLYRFDDADDATNLAAATNAFNQANARDYSAFVDSRLVPNEASTNPIADRDSSDPFFRELSASPAYYVPFIETSSGCFVAGSPAQIGAPAVPSFTGISTSATQSRCFEPLAADRTGSSITITIEGTVDLSLFNYVYEIIDANGDVIGPITIAAGDSPITRPVPFDEAVNLTYTIRVYDTVTENCGVFTDTQTINACTPFEKQPLSISAIANDLDCFEGTDPDGTATITIVDTEPAFSLNYDFTITPNDGSVAIPNPSSGTNQTSGTINVSNLQPDILYTIAVIDNNNEDPTARRQPLVNFSVENPEETGAALTENTPLFSCPSGNRTANVVARSLDGQPPYNFELRNPAGDLVSVISGQTNPTIGSTNPVANFSFDSTNGDGTYTLVVTDGNGCMAEDTLNVTFPPEIQIDAVVLNGCIPNAANTNPVAVRIDVTDLSGIAPGGNYIYRWYAQGTDPSLLPAFSSPFSSDNPIFINDTGITSAGIYVVEVQDEASGCPVTDTFEILAPVTASLTANAPIRCDADGNIPSNRFVYEATLSIMGGIGAPYDLEVFDGTGTEITDQISIPDRDTATPRFLFTSAFDTDARRAISIRVIDNASPVNCQLATPTTFSIEVPEFPSATIEFDPIECNNGNTNITINATPTSETLEYRFCGEDCTEADLEALAFVSGANVANGIEAGVFRYQVRNSLGCIFSDDFNIEEPSEIAVVFDNQNVTCNTLGSGSDGIIRAQASGGALGGAAVRYTYELVGNGATLRRENTTTQAIFNNIEADITYQLTVTVLTNSGVPTSCTLTRPVTLPNNPSFDAIGFETEVTDCNSGVSLYFVLDNANDASQLEIEVEGANFISPEASFTDDVARFGNTDFTSDTGIDFSVGIANSPEAQERYFRITNLPFKTAGEEYVIRVRELGTLNNCPTTLEFPAEVNPFITITEVNPTPTGACTADTGALEVVFEVSDTSLLGETFTAEVFDGTTSLGTPGSGVITTSPGTLIITGLPEITTATVVVSSGSCEATAPSPALPVNPMLESPSGGSTLANCNDNAVLSLSASGGSGNYSFSITNINAAVPGTFEALGTSSFEMNSSEAVALDSRITLVENISSPTAAQQAVIDSDPFVFGLVDIWVRDSNLCVAGPVPVGVRRVNTPSFTILDIANECDGNSFDVSYQIGNYDANQAYRISGSYSENINAASLTAVNATTVTGTFTVSNRGDFDINLSGNATACTVPASFTIFSPFTTTVTAGNANCDGSITGISIAALNNGFINPNRSVVYELYQGTDTSGGVIDTPQTVNAVNPGIVTFNTGLVTATSYLVVIRDIFDPSNGSSTRVCERSFPVAPVDAIPSITVANETPVSPSCPDTATGSVEITVSPGTVSISEYALFFYSSAVAADNHATTPSTNVTRQSTPDFFGLEDGFYVAEATIDGTVCSTASIRFEIQDPVLPVIADFNIAGNQVCDNTTETGERSASISITFPTLPDDGDYVYRIVRAGNFDTGDVGFDNTSDNPILIENIPFPEVDGQIFTYTVSITDNSRPTCPQASIGSQDVTFTACPEFVPDPEEVDIQVLPTAVACSDEELFDISFRVTDTGDPNFPFTYDVFGGPPFINDQGNNITVDQVDLTGLSVDDRDDYQITLISLDPDNYVFSENRDVITVPLLSPGDLFIPNPLSVSLVDVTPICNGNAYSESLELRVPDGLGTGPFTFELFPVVDNSDPDNIILGTSLGTDTPVARTSTAFSVNTNGNYRVVVTDNTTGGPCSALTDFPIVLPNPLDATLTPLDICLPDTDLRVDIASGSSRPTRYRYYRSGTTPPSFDNLITTTTSQFNIQDIDEAGTWTVDITNDDGCIFSLGDVIINETLTTTNVNRFNPTCTADGDVPGDGATISFMVTGGTSSYLYTFDKVTTDNNGDEILTPVTRSDVAISGTNANPTFGFDRSMFNGATIQITINDSNVDGTCNLSITERFGPLYPENLTAGFMTNAILCEGESGSIVVDRPTTGSRAFTYTFYEADLFVDVATSTPLQGPSNVPSYSTTIQLNVIYVVDDTTTGCRFVSSAIAISDTTVQADNITATDVTCLNANAGSVTVNVSRGSGTFRYELLDPNDTSLPAIATINKTPADTDNRQAVFTSLVPDEYLVRITDTGNSCPTSIETETVRVAAVSDIEIRDIIGFACDDASGATFIFSVFEPGITLPAPYEIGINGATPVDPSADLTDDFYTFDEADTAGIVPAGINISTSQRERFYVVTRLPIGVEHDLIILNNSTRGGTGCTRSAQLLQNTDPIEDIRGFACDDDGGATFIFSVPGNDPGPFLISVNGGPNIDPSADLNDNFYTYAEAAAVSPAVIPSVFPIPDASEQNEFYIVTGLPTAIDNVLVVTSDTSRGGTGCEREAVLRRDTDVIDTITVTPTGITNCPSDSVITLGSAIVNFTVGTSTATDFEMTLLDADTFAPVGGILPANPIAPTVANTDFTFTNLPAGDYVVQVYETGSSCGTISDPFTIEEIPPLVAPTVLSNSPANCNEDALVTVTASGGNPFDTGVPYQYAIRLDGDVTPVTSLPFAQDDSFEIAITPPATSAMYELYVRDENNCIVRGANFTINRTPEPQVSIVTPVSSNQCNGTSNFPVTIRIDNYVNTRAPYRVEIQQGTEITNQILNVDEGTFEAEISLPRRGNFTITVFDNIGCNDAGNTFEVREALTAMIDPTPTANCDGTITDINVTISGGSADPANVTYELFRNGISIVGPQASPNFASSPLLITGADYEVVVRDTFETINGTPLATACSATTIPINILPIERSTPDEIIEISPITCTDDTDGELRLALDAALGTSPALPIEFALYIYTSEVDALAAIAEVQTSGVAPSTGTQIGTVQSSDLFSNLDDGWYVGFVINNSCYTAFPIPAELVNPDPHVVADITGTVIEGSCNPNRNPVYRISVNNVAGIEPYFYQIDGGPRILIPGTDVVDDTTIIPPLEVDVNLTPGPHTITFSDSVNPICFVGPLREENPIIPEFRLPEIVVSQSAAFDCLSDEVVDIVVTGNRTTTYEVAAFRTDGTLITPIPSVLAIQSVAPNDDEFTVQFTLTEPGTYVFEATDTAGNGCSVVSDPYSFENVEQLGLSLIGAPMVDCVGDEDAAITFRVDNFEGFFAYDITPRPTGSTFPIIVDTAAITDSNREVSSPAIFGAGDYVLSVTAVADISGTPQSSRSECTATRMDVRVGDPITPVELRVNDVDPITCSNESVGVDIVAQGLFGNPQYEFQLRRIAPTVADIQLFGMTPINDTGVFAGITEPGTYEVSIRDSKNCEALMPTEIVIEEFRSLPNVAITTVQPNCPGDRGSIVVDATINNSISGEENPIIYRLLQLDNAAGDNPRTVIGRNATLASGVFTAREIFEDQLAGLFNETDRIFYQVEVEDRFGCTMVSNIDFIRQPQPLDIQLVQVEIPMSCDIRIQAQGETEQVRFRAEGGTGALTFEVLAANEDGSIREPEQVLTSSLNFNDLDSNGNPITPLALNSGDPNEALFELIPGFNYIRVTDANGCSETTFYQVGNPPLPIEATITVLPDSDGVLCQDTTGLVNIVGNARGGVGNYTYEVVLIVPDNSQPTGFRELTAADSPRIPVILGEIENPTSTLFTDLIGLRFDRTPVADGGNGLPVDMTYGYKITSGSCPVFIEPFDYNERLINLEPIETTRPSCANEEDASIAVTFANPMLADAGEYTITIIRESRPDGSGNFELINAEARLFNLTDDISQSRTVTFDNLLDGNYLIRVNSADGCLVVEQTRIEPKEPLVVREISRTPIDVFINLDTGSRESDVCQGDNYNITFEIEGGTPPYFYQLIEANSEEPLNPELNLWGIVNEVDFDRTNANGPGFYVTIDQNLIDENTQYELFVIDTGNGFVRNLDQATIDDTDPTNDNFNYNVNESDTILPEMVCRIFSTSFEFTAPILDQFVVEPFVNCIPETPGDILNYNLRVNIPENTGLNEEDITYIAFVDDGSGNYTNRLNAGQADEILLQSGFDPRLDDNIIANVPAGEVFIGLRYQYVNRAGDEMVCYTFQTNGGNITPEFENLSINPINFEGKRLELPFFNELMFETDLSNNTLIENAPYIEAIGLNEYRIQGRDGFGSNSYSYEVINSVTGNIPVSSDGQFTITETAEYTLTVISNTNIEATDGNLIPQECRVSETELLKFIDLEIPNVFYPGSGEIGESTWYPDQILFDDVPGGNNLEEFRNLEVMIFDRYGRLIADFKGLKDRSIGEGWDGTYEGSNLPSGDYWFLIKLNDNDNREFTGHFTLYRKSGN